LLWQRKARNALGGSNMGSTEPLAGDIALELLDNKLLFIDDRFYEISNGDTPRTWPASMTGRCRIRFSVITAMHSSMFCPGSAYATRDVIISSTDVVLEERPWRITFRA